MVTRSVQYGGHIAEASKICLLRPEGGVKVSQRDKCRMSVPSWESRVGDWGRGRRERERVRMVHCMT